jgi:hypothetical protein
MQIRRVLAAGGVMAAAILSTAAIATSVAGTTQAVADNGVINAHVMHANDGGVIHADGITGSD